MIHPITQLLDDIRATRDLILYYENQILRKEIAIEELRDIAERSADDADSPSLRELVVTTILEDVNGNTFRPMELESVVLKRFPEYEQKIAGKVRTICSELVTANQLIRVQHGVYRKAVASTPKE